MFGAVLSDLTAIGDIATFDGGELSLGAVIIVVPSEYESSVASGGGHSMSRERCFNGYQWGKQSLYIDIHCVCVQGGEWLGMELFIDTKSSKKILCSGAQMHYTECLR